MVLLKQILRRQSESLVQFYPSHLAVILASFTGSPVILLHFLHKFFDFMHREEFKVTFVLASVQFSSEMQGESVKFDC